MAGIKIVIGSEEYTIIKDENITSSEIIEHETIALFD